MDNPVILVKTSQTYEKFALEQWLLAHDTCPLTGVSLDGNHQTISNIALKESINEWHLQSNANINLQSNANNNNLQSNATNNIPQSNANNNNLQSDANNNNLQLNNNIPANTSLLTNTNNPPNYLQLVLSTDIDLSTDTTATLSTPLLLISRIPAYYTFDRIRQDLDTISSMLNLTFDIAEFTIRYRNNQHIYLRDDTRISIILQLLTPQLFSTTGCFNTPTLPFFFFTPSDRNNRRGTSRRLTVQALPCDSILTVDNSIEFSCIRGLPDNPHTISAIFAIIWRDLLQTIPDEPILPILSSSMNRRRISNDSTTFFDEVFIRLRTSPGTDISRLRRLLNLTPGVPLHHTALSWSGEIATSFTHYVSSPTNNPHLLSQPTAIVLENINDPLPLVLLKIQPFLLSPISYAYLIYGIMDAPWRPYHSNTLVLVSEHNGTVPHFDEAAYLSQFPSAPSPLYLYLPGYESLSLIYSTNPTPEFPLLAQQNPRSRRITGTPLVPNAPLPPITLSRPPSRRTALPNLSRSASSSTLSSSTTRSLSTTPTAPPFSITSPLPPPTDAAALTIPDPSSNTHSDRLTRLEAAMTTLQHQHSTQSDLLTGIAQALNRLNGLLNHFDPSALPPPPQYPQLSASPYPPYPQLLQYPSL